MAEFLTTSGTSHNLENIIIEAKYNITLVSPYLQISKTLFERLKEAALRRVKIKIVYGKDDLKQNERKSLEAINALQLYYFENLHAKCYFNEKTMVITSMNMYEFSERKNREMGILIDHKIDKNIYDKAEKEVNSILQFLLQLF
jgi:phosphatidylserine/phosphatidylglycerophosphate/cardiolipin synthase-like enzyme